MSVRRVRPVLIGVWLLTVMGLVLALVGSGRRSAQAGALVANEPSIIPGPELVIRAAPPQPGASRVFVSPPDASWRLNPFAPNVATINVTYVGTWDPQAQAAFQYAVDIWAGLLDSSVAISVQANWTDLGAATGILGSAGAKYRNRDFAGAPATSTWFAIALADRRYCADQVPGDFDIVANFNSAFADWYFGTDGLVPASKWDLATVVLHELGHGLGFAGSMRYDDGNAGNGTECAGTAGQGCWGFGTGFPYMYDRFVEDASAVGLLNTATYPNPSAALGTRLTGNVNSLFWNGIYGIAGNSATKPVLYSPTTWQSGSSYSHFDQSTYATELMKPALPPQTAIHNPGSRTLGVLRDIGWGQELVINAFAYSPTGSRAEWVQIKNTSSVTISLSDYAIGDEERQGAAGEGSFLLPNVSLAPGQVFLMRIRSDGAWTYSTQPNPTYCWNCTSGYTNLTQYTLWGGTAPNLTDAGDEIVLLRTNGGVADVDGVSDDTIVDAMCYGTGLSYVDTNNTGALDGRDINIFTGGGCLSTLASGSFQRPTTVNTCVPASAYADNPTAVTLTSVEANNTTEGDAKPLTPLVLVLALGVLIGPVVMIGVPAYNRRRAH
ncbi:MAG: lamin tail domain-containing protein [Thermoflexales bacterium]|nr:lamin tail domain-containing protein [Thermoflexales bacterium]